jgi:hypothetical protein
VYTVLVEKPEEKRPQATPRRTLEDGIKMDLKEIAWESADWIRLA